MASLVADNLTVEIDGQRIVDQVSLRLEPDQLTAVLGPNGAGKTTLLRALLGLIPAAGKIQLNDQPIGTTTAAERAKQVAYLPQQRPIAWPNTVADIVALGRFAHGAALGKLSDIDQAAVEEAILACDIQHLRDRRVDTLSGGELARMHFARAIAAQTPLLIADEPSAALDPRHQMRVAKLLRNYVDGGGGALVVLHDVSLAASIADQLIWMRDGQIKALGPPADTLNPDTLAQVYDIDARVIDDVSGPVIVVDEVR